MRGGWQERTGDTNSASRPLRRPARSRRPRGWPTTGRNRPAASSGQKI